MVLSQPPYIIIIPNKNKKVYKKRKIRKMKTVSNFFIMYKKYLKLYENAFKRGGGVVFQKKVNFLTKWPGESNC